MKSAQVDAYIQSAPEYAKPILKKIRALFHKACPKLEEHIKWRMPSFEYHGLLGGMAAFKNHVTWGFWKSSLLDDPHGIMRSDASSPMSAGNPTKLEHLPPDTHMLALIKQAMKLNEDGVKLPNRSSKPRPAPKTPADLLAALKKNKAALTTFENFSPSCKREYIEWITGAKRDETRTKRIKTAVEWMAEGKKQNWRYETCRS